MKTVILLFSIAFCLLEPVGSQAEATKEKVTVELTSGDKITGTVSGIRDGSVCLITDFGVVRVPMEKLSEASRKQLGIGKESDVASLRQRIAELEQLVEKLREENAMLRRKTGQGSPTIQPLTGGGNAGIQPAESNSVEGGGYWLSSTGKRHNSRCRYYKKSKGRPCGPSEGVACKICGG